MRKILAVAAVLAGVLVPLHSGTAQAYTPRFVPPCSSVPVTIADRQDCAVQGKRFLDCLSVDLARVACGSRLSVWQVTGIEQDPNRCLTGGTVPLQGKSTTLCLYPVWEG